MTPPFPVRGTPRFERMAQKLLKHHPELRAVIDRAREILTSDPYNRTLLHPIKKLVGAQCEGQYRLRLGRWRFRYDVQGGEVVLQYCGLRREETYR